MQNSNFPIKMCLPHYLVKISKQRTNRNKGFSVSIFPCRERSIGTNYVYFQNYHSEDPLQIRCSFSKLPWLKFKAHSEFHLLTGTTDARS